MHKIDRIDQLASASVCLYCQIFEKSEVVCILALLMCTFGIIMFNVYNYVVGLTFKRISFKHFRSSNIFDLALIEENFFRGLLIM